MKVFRICNSSELPSYQDREDNYIYFTYDELNIYIGKSSQYNGYYAIVENLPEIGEQIKPVEIMYYITMDGNINVYHNESEDWEVIAEIEDSSQIEYLTKAGTTFLMRAGYKYIDYQRKILCLPYQHGEFQLSVMLDKPIIIDDSTIIVYNPETGKFEIDGLRYYDEYGRNPEIMKYTGVDSDSTHTYIQNDHIHVDAKISPKAGNILESRADGLYVSGKKYATLEEFNELVTRTQAEMSAYTAFMNEIEESMRHVDITLSDETLEEMIRERLNEEVPGLQEAVENINTLIEDFTEAETHLVEYITESVDRTMEEVVERIESIPNSWGFLANKLDFEVEYVSAGRYKINVDIVVEPGYKLYYKKSLMYLYQDQDISDLSFMVLNNGDVININPGSTVTVCYTREDSGHSYTQSFNFKNIE